MSVLKWVKITGADFTKITQGNVSENYITTVCGTFDRETMRSRAQPSLTIEIFRNEKKSKETNEREHQMKAAIVIDDWKLPIFNEHLTNSKYQFEQHPGVAPGTLTLTVVTNDVKALEKVVRSANLTAATRKGNNNGQDNTH